MELKENAHNDYFISFRKKGFENRLLYINTLKQLILDLYDCKNDNFHVKIVKVLLFFAFFVLLKNKLLVHLQSIFKTKKKKKKNVFPCLNLSISI